MNTIKKIVYRDIRDIHTETIMERAMNRLREDGRKKYSEDTEAMLADLWNEKHSKDDHKDEEDSSKTPKQSKDMMSDEEMERVAVYLSAKETDEDTDELVATADRGAFNKYKHHRFVRRWGLFADSEGIDEEWFIASPSVLPETDHAYLCNKCRHIDFKILFSQRGLPGNVQPGKSTIELGNLSHILVDQHCAFCRLVRRIVEGNNLFKDEQDEPITNETYQLNVLDEGPEYGLRLDLEIASHGEHHPRFILQVLDPDGEMPLSGLQVIQDTADMSRLRKWISEYGQETHDDQQSPEPGAITLRLIDTVDNCVRDVSTPCQYASLSYVWGQGSQLMLTTATRERLEAQQGLEDATLSLPQTIIDAIEVTRSVGLRYLWIDALCIIQDDPDDKAAIISNMGYIYSNAALTIVASTNFNPTEGLPGVGVPRSRTQITQSIQGMIIGVAFHDARKPNPDIETSRWNSRAWTFQERMLSAKTVYFTESQMIFVHGNTSAFEDTVSVPDQNWVPTPINDQTQFNSRMTDLWARVWTDPTQSNYGNKAFQLPNCTMAIIKEDEDSPDGCCQQDAPIYSYKDISLSQQRNNSPFEIGRTIWETYTKAVTAYTKRRMSHQSDAVNAFLGIADKISQGLNTEFWYGMPEFALTQALLWEPPGPLRRRMQGDKPLFPSWAWTAWEGPVSYRGRGWHNSIHCNPSPVVQWLFELNREEFVESLKTQDAPADIIEAAMTMETIVKETFNADLFHRDFEERDWKVERDEARNMQIFTHGAYPHIRFSYPIYLPDQKITQLPNADGKIHFNAHVAPVRFCDMNNTSPVQTPIEDKFFQIGLSDEKRSSNYRQPWQRIIYHQGYRAGFLTLNIPLKEIDLDSDEYYLAAMSRDSQPRIPEPSLNYHWMLNAVELQQDAFSDEWYPEGVPVLKVNEDAAPSSEPKNENGDPQWEEDRFGRLTIYDIYNVLLLKRVGRDSVRVGSGKVSHCAYKATEPEKEMVKLI